MREAGNNVNKVCSFYVNDWHLTTMLLPFVNNSIQENKKVLTILQNGMKSNIEELISKMNLKTETTNKILEIDWNSKITCKYSKIKEEIGKDVQAINIIVKGNEEYLKIANKNIVKVIQNVSEKEITIINCYEITKYKKINNILDEHEYVLNTSGINEISKVFVDYKKEESKIG